MPRALRIRPAFANLETMAEGIEIRRLGERDAAALWALRLAALDTEPNAFAESAGELRRTSVEAYAERLRLASADGFVLGAFDGPQLVGMVGLHREQWAKRRHKARIWGVFVRESHRGAGIGRALMAAAVERARAAPDIRQLHLSVATTQTRARRVYLDLGFRPIGVEPDALAVDGAYVDEEHMYLPLRDPA
jgi:RimJ/RimL family protein N-acetyltransferase